MYDYAIRFEKDTAPGLAVYCRDLPQFNSFGDNLDHALTMAVDGIETTLSIYVDERKAIPAATPPEEGEHVVHLPAVTVAKIILWNAMMDRGMRKADLCRLLGVSQTQGDRVVDFLHSTKMDAIESALRALNIRIRVEDEVAVDPTTIWIELPESKAGSGFRVSQLVDCFHAANSREMVVGKLNGDLGDIKEHSVDFILRSVFASPNKANTRQATTSVIDALIATGQFRRSRMIDPVTNREVDSLALR